jgi:hypothetical protein
MTTPLAVIPEDEPIPYGIRDVRHPQYGIPRVVRPGKGSVTMTYMLSSEGVAVDMSDSGPVQNQGLNVIFLFDKLEAIYALEHVLANAKLLLRNKTLGDM